MKTITIDASVFISSFFAKEIHHHSSKAFLCHTKAKSTVQVLIPTLTLFEVLQAYYKNTHDPKRTDEIFQGFIEWNLTRQIRFLNLEANFMIYFSMHHHRFDLKTSDTVLALTAHRLKAPLITWDRQLIKKCKGKIEAMTPEEWMNREATPTTP